MEIKQEKNQEQEADVLVDVPATQETPLVKASSPLQQQPELNLPEPPPSLLPSQVTLQAPQISPQEPHVTLPEPQVSEAPVSEDESNVGVTMVQALADNTVRTDELQVLQAAQNVHEALTDQAGNNLVYILTTGQHFDYTLVDTSMLANSSLT